MGALGPNCHCRPANAKAATKLPLAVRTESCAICIHRTHPDTLLLTLAAPLPASSTLPTKR